MTFSSSAAQPGQLDQRAVGVPKTGNQSGPAMEPAQAAQGLSRQLSLPVPGSPRGAADGLARQLSLQPGGLARQLSLQALGQPEAAATAAAVAAATTGHQGAGAARCDRRSASEVGKKRRRTAKGAAPASEAPAALPLLSLAAEQEGLEQAERTGGEEGNKQHMRMLKNRQAAAASR